MFDTLQSVMLADGRLTDTDRQTGFNAAPERGPSPRPRHGRRAA